MSQDPSEVNAYLERSSALVADDRDVARVMERLGTSSRQHRRRRVMASVSALTAAVLAITVLSVPAGRANLRDGFANLSDFFDGGAPDGRALPPADAGGPGSLNWLYEAKGGSPRILAQLGTLRLVAYRDATTGYPCLSYGRHVEECAPGKDWRQQLTASPILLRGPTLPEASGKQALWGLAGERVARLQVVYEVGDIEQTSDVGDGFVLAIDPERRPEALSVLDDRGTLLATLDLRDRGRTEPVSGD